MLDKHAKASIKQIFTAGLLFLMVSGNSAFAALVEYKANLFGPGLHVHNCMDLDSRGSLFGDYSEDEGTLSNVSGVLKHVTITDGFIKRGYNNVKNYVLGTFNDNVPRVLRGMNIFVDLSRGADYAETKVTNSKIREWGWALFYDPNEYTTAEELFTNKDSLRTIVNPYKTFGELCPKYAGGNSSSYNGWCSAGVELYADYGTPAPVPLPAAFYLLSAGMIGLVSFSKKRHST